jgi:beta-lactamase regulating signal transducer with metallopeptidase domain
MNLPLMLASPGFVMLFKWTGLLALGWLAHWCLRHQHARWRLILWRSILGFSLILPLLNHYEIPGIKIPINRGIDSAAEITGPLPPAVGAAQIQTAASAAQPLRPPAAGSPAPSPASSPAISLQPAVLPKSYSWGIILAGIWALGCFCGAVRLVRLQFQLSRLRKEACEPSPDLGPLVKQIQIRLQVRREVDIQISDAVTSPFICGLLKPMVILPRTLAQNLSPGELSALLSHEIAHLRQRDLLWCVAWRWMKTVGWFHPLVWKIPAAHNLACEQEADRIASGQLADQDSYAQLLARLALRVLALPAVETKLTLNGSSQIVRRLNHLGRKHLGAWNWRHSVAAFVLTGVMFLLTAGCEITKSASNGSNLSTKLEFKEVLVVVQDEDGKPIAGATVLPTGFRVKGRHGADAYGWNQKLFGPAVKAVTDAAGKAYVKYPVEGIPEEKEFTGKLIFSVSHPEYATVRPDEYSVDSPEQPIQLTRGIQLEVSGYFGSDHQPVTELIPNLTEGVHPEEWQKEDNGVFAFHKLSPGGHLLQLMGRLPSGEIVYSDTMAFTAVKGKPCHFAMEMRPGVRLEGRLDDQVPRPVMNGRVMIDVRPKEYPVLDVIEDYYDADTKYGGRHFWHSYRPISEDGTFVFESVPPGEADIVVLGDGFASKTIGQLQNRVNGVLQKGAVMAIPQAFPLVSPVTKIEVTTEPTATLDFTASTKWGRPIEGVSVGMWPSAFRMWGQFGWLKNSSEEPYRVIPHLPDPIFSGKTDIDGKLVLKNIPGETHGIEMEHPQFQVPLQDIKGWRDRYVRATFSPGVTNKLKLTLEPKGTDYVGGN